MNRTLLMAWALPCLILAPALAQAGQQVYVWVDEQGVRHYSDEVFCSGGCQIKVESSAFTQLEFFTGITISF